MMHLHLPIMPFGWCLYWGESESRLRGDKMGPQWNGSHQASQHLVGWTVSKRLGWALSNICMPSNLIILYMRGSVKGSEDGTQILRGLSPAA